MSSTHPNNSDSTGTKALSAGCCDHHETEIPLWPTRSLALAAILAVTAVILRWTGFTSEIVTNEIAAAAVAFGGWFLLPSAWQAILRMRPNINLLMVIATAGAGIVGEWPEAATVVVLFGVAEWLEGWADRRASRATRALLELAPDTARVRKPDGNFEERPVAEVSIGAIVNVQAGQRIPLDGMVESGDSSVNQAPITGESVPVEVQPGTPVFAGTINGEGSLEIEVTKSPGDTTLAKIIRLVEQAQAQKAPTQRFVDTFARYYTPTVAIGALLVFLIPPLLFGGVWSVWLYRACVLLIIACPCALVISTPVSIVVGLTVLASRGVLVKGGAHLETIGRLQALAVDKTGTITEGKPRVIEVVGRDGYSRTDVVRAAAAIDDHSAHPLAQAVVAHAREHRVEFQRAQGFQARTGRGAEAVIDGHPHFVGNHRFAHELGVCSPDLEFQLATIESRGQSVVVVGHKPHENCAGKVLGFIAVGDTVRVNASAAIADLHTAGVKRVVILSGDNQRTVDFIANEVDIDDAQGDLLPDDKVAAIGSLLAQHGMVAMVGDGVNDAPAMANASLGIAMGAAGTDAAIESADITLMQDDLGMIAKTVRLGRRTLGIIRFNIVFALALKAIFLGLAIFGFTSLWLAILADTGATLLVIMNALRLVRSHDT